MPWRLLGPTNVYNGQLGYRSSGGTGTVSGRVTALAVHPNMPEQVYVGTASGGVWRSDNAGRAWRPLMDARLNFSIGAMAFETAAPYRLFIAPGESNRGGPVFTGTGLHVYNPSVAAPADPWTFDAGPGTSFERVYSGALVSFRKSNKTNLLLGNSNGVFWWKDDGSGWADISFDLPAATRSIVSLAYNYVTGTVHACVYEGGIYRMALGGNSWDKKTSDDPGEMALHVNQRRSAVAVCATSPGTIYALLGANGTRELLALYRSDDDGETWVKREIPPDSKSSDYLMALAVHPRDADTLFVGNARLYKSEDGGKGWTAVSEPDGNYQGVHADQHVIIHHPQAVDAGKAHSNEWWLGNDGGVWRSDDEGVTWSPRNRGLATMQYYSLAQHPKHPTVLLAGAQDNGVQRYEGGSAWNLVAEGDGFFCAIDPVNQYRWYSSYMFQPKQESDDLAAIQCSDEAGARDSWSYNVEGINPNDTIDSDPFYVPFVLHPKDNKKLFLGTSRLYLSVNAGELWTAVLQTDGNTFSTGDKWANRITAIEVYPDKDKDKQIVYVGTADGRVFRLKQDAASGNWVSTLKNIAAGGQIISDLAVAVDGAKTHVYAAVGSHHTPWMPVVAVASRVFYLDDSAPANAFVARGSNQLDYTADGQTVTHAWNPVNAIAVDPRFPQRLYIGCNYGGVFRSDNLGQAWASVSAGLPNVPIADLLFQEEHKLLRAATIGRSVWELEVDSAAPARAVDLQIRATVADTGAKPYAAAGPDPLAPEQQYDLKHSPDILVDTPGLAPFGSYQDLTSTDTYAPDGKADDISFSNFVHDGLRAGAESRVYVRVHNRGNAAVNADVRLFYAQAGADGALPDMPDGFWGKAWNAAADQFAGWVPAGDKTSVYIEPAQAGVVSWTFEPPSQLSGQAGLLAITTAAEDPLPAGASLKIEELATNEKRAALRLVGIGPSDADVWIPVLVLVGAVVAGTVIAVAANNAEPQG